ncbi:DNA primase [Acidicapsa dinghuensis]|uniref:DNA primase n=1 Tax=Acidicapsa dinghuensis TaxID=2218256 RepID=A0ABW1EJN0_9BACT|nr:DNA primase [Acidicapsa dinghuensis]
MSDFAQTVKQHADIVKIIGGYIRLRKAGAQNYNGLCPFHKEKSPSFSVHASRQFYHCFGCGQSGDVFSFVAKIENLTFPEAVRAVAQKCGIPLPKKEFHSAEEAAEAGLRRKLLDLHEAATVWFQEQLRSPEGALAREYLSGRGVTPEAVKTFRIGYAPDNFNALRDRFASQFDPETLRASGLFKWKDQEGGPPPPAKLYDAFRRRIMFPICHESGRVIAFTGRLVDSPSQPAGEKAGPKYFNSPETPLYTKGHVLFNLDKAKAAMRAMEFALLVEGQMDCISVYMRGIQNVIATSGTAFTEQQVALLRRQTTNAVVNFDPDLAGSNAAEKSIALLTEEGFSIRIITLDGGLDPDRFVRERGVEAYVAAIKGARSQADYLIERARAEYPGSNSADKINAMNYLLPHIRRIPHKLERDQFAHDAAQKLGIDSALLREELRQAALKRQDHIEPRGINNNSAGLLPFERFFVESACNDEKSPEEYAELHQNLRAFDDKTRAQSGEDWQRHVLPNLPAGLFDRLVNRAQKQDVEITGDTEEQKIFLRKVFLEAGELTKTHQQDMEIVRDLEIQALRWILGQKRAAISSASDPNSPETLRLMQEILQLERKLRDLECGE